MLVDSVLAQQIGIFYKQNQVWAEKQTSWVKLIIQFSFPSWKTCGLCTYMVRMRKGGTSLEQRFLLPKKRPGSNLSGFSQFNLKNDFDVIFTYKVRSLSKYFMNRLIGPLQNTSNWFRGCVTNLMFIRLYNKQCIQCKFALADDHLSQFDSFDFTNRIHVHVNLVIKK